MPSGTMLRMTRSSPWATAMPSPPPTRASTRLSVRNCAEDLAARGSHGAANGNLALPYCAFGQQQIGDVDAGDEKHESDRAEKQPEVANSVGGEEVVLQRFYRCAPSFIGFRISGGNVGGDRVHVGLGLLDGDTGLEAAHGQDPVIVVVDLLGREGQRDTSVPDRGGRRGRAIGLRLRYAARR